MTDEPSPLLVGTVRAQLLDDYVFGTGVFDPAYPSHGAIRRCPFCGTPYRVHGGVADHRDRCEKGSCPGANPAGPAEGGESA